jgi:putative PIN family toxin of toxin-antitoxin system
VRVVLDVNVLVSAMAFPGSVPRQAMDIAMEESRILLSLPVLTELRDVLNREKLARYISPSLRLSFLSNLAKIGEMVEITDRIVACRDPKDDKILDLAVSGHANCVITGDRDLLILNPFRNIAIITPKSFLIGA